MNINNLTDRLRAKYEQRRRDIVISIPFAKTVKMIKRVSESINYNCEFVDGICRNYNPKHNSLKMNCCYGCNTTLGWNNYIYSKNQEKVLIANYDPKLGFWREGKGCILPREYRSDLCLSHICTSRKKMDLGKIVLMDDSFKSVSAIDYIVSSKNCTVKEAIETFTREYNSEKSWAFLEDMAYTRNMVRKRCVMCDLLLSLHDVRTLWKQHKNVRMKGDKKGRQVLNGYEFIIYSGWVHEYCAKFLECQINGPTN